LNLFGDLVVGYFFFLFFFLMDVCMHNVFNTFFFSVTLDIIGIFTILAHFLY
jgi:hypothetical protein